METYRFWTVRETDSQFTLSPNYRGVFTAVVAYVDEESVCYRMTQESCNCRCTVNELLVGLQPKDSTVASMHL